MINNLTRENIFDNFQAVTSVIVEMQTSMFDEDPLFEDGDDGKWYFKLYDALNIPAQDVSKWYSVISFDHDDLDSFTNVLSEKLIQLLTLLDVSELLVISHLKLNFIENSNNDYPLFQNAIKKFEAIAGNSQYEEAFKINTADLPLMLEIIFWITRCDAGSPEYIFFSDVNEKMAFNICKSGNVHIIEYHKESIFDELIEKLGLYFIDGHCKERFSSSSKIKGRKSGRKIR